MNITNPPLRILGLAFAALIFFAANSVFARMALLPSMPTMDPGSFVLIRLLSAILMLALLMAIRPKKTASVTKGSWLASFWLFVYALSFAYAYQHLDAGSGALVLFGCVQIVMFFAARYQGVETHLIAVLGVLLAMAGLFYLMWPLLSTPSIVGVVLMAVSGAAWALYTLAGRASKDPLADTSYNFLRTLPLCVLLFAYLMIKQQLWLSSAGVLLAVASGALASGIGYAIWYSALRGLNGVQAGSLQLLVPALASLGGILFASDSFSWRLVVSTLITLTGIALVLKKSN